MKIELPDTTTAEIAAGLQHFHETSLHTTGRVLTLIVSATDRDDLEGIIAVTTDASREHPARVLVLIDSTAGDPAGVSSRIDANILVGGSAGASEVVIMRLHGQVAAHPDAIVTPLLLPDTPIVAWWPSAAPEVPAADPIGSIAQRRITDALLDPADDPLKRRRHSYRPGDTDLAWTRITQWRGLVASTLDIKPYKPIRRVRLDGSRENLSLDLAAGWLAAKLRVPVARGFIDEISTAQERELLRACELTLYQDDGTIRLENKRSAYVAVEVSGHPETLVALTHRTPSDCLSEELRHLDPDVAYEEALRGIDSVAFD